MKRRVLAKASEDAGKIYEWIAKRTRGGADRWFVALRAAWIEIERNPLLYPIVPQSKNLGVEIRAFVFHTRMGPDYTLYHEVRQSEIGIHRIRGPGQAQLRGRSLLGE